MSKPDIWRYDPVKSPEMPLPDTDRLLRGDELLKGDDLTGHDTGNAARLVKMYKRVLRYSNERKKWLIFWSGARMWRWDETGVRLKIAEKVLYETQRQAHVAGDDYTGKLARRSMDDLRRMERMLKLAEPRLAVSLDLLDQHPDLLVFKNGTLNLATGELGKSRPEHFITRRLEYDYEDEAEAGLFLSFLSRALGSHAAMSGSEADELRQMLDAVQLYLGYCLTGHTSSKAIFIWHGPPDTGKTTLLNLFLRMLGSYAVKIQIESLMRGAEQTNAAHADLADLHGARFAMSSEVGQGQKIDVRRLKNITQGGGRIKARRLAENPFEFTESHKLNLDSNYLPVVPEDDEALWRRFVPVPFRVVIPEHEQDRELPEKLLALASGVLAWAARGARRWYEGGGQLSRPRCVRDASDAYRSAMDLVSEFITDCCERDDGASIGSTDLYRAWEHWQHERRLRPLSHRAFSLKVKKLGFELDKLEVGNAFLGLKL
jgi:putative DNA primase/helicase